MKGPLCISSDTSKAYNMKNVSIAHGLEHIGDQSNVNADG
jgi:hypothetical protein